MSLDLSAYKPQTGTTSDATAISNAFTACETDSASLWTQTNQNTTDIATLSGGGSTLVPPGVMFDYGGTAAPSGFLLCDGSTVSRTTYASLFAAVSTRFGAGDGSTTFNLPDFRGRIPVGYAPSGGHTDVATVGNNDGVALVNRRPKHTHTYATLAVSTHTHSFGTLNASAASLTMPTHSHSVTPEATSFAYNTNTGKGLVAAPTSDQIGYKSDTPTIGNPTSVGSFGGSISMSGSTATTQPTLSGTIGTGTAVDTPCYVVCTKIIKT